MKASLVAVAVAAAFAPWAVQGQEVKKLEQVTVTASPLGRADTELAQPVTVLSEDDLRRKRAGSLGDTLSQELGVQSSAFGAGAGRPIVRGLDGPRIRVLENGIGTLDASTVSPDHAVTTESLNAEQIEILRGPASLLYGSGAIGGVVNVVSKLVPRERPVGFPGAVELRAGSANRERTAAANLEGGAGDFALHLDAFRRKTRDYDTPVGTLANSAVDAKGAGIGGSWVGSRGYLGLGVQRLENLYGVPTGEGVTIDLAQTRVEAAGELTQPLPGFAKLKFRVGHSDYHHVEIEGDGTPATRFENRGSEGRIELAHDAIGGVKGTLGAQLQDREQAAIGEEAILPRTRSRSAAVFLVEQYEQGPWTFDAGIRFERETRRPEGDLPARDFSIATPAVGLVWKLSEDLRLGISATQAARAPSAEELYTFGAHHATATFELGDANLRKEVSRNVDVTLRKVTGNSRWKVNVFANRFSDFIHTVGVDADGDGIADRVDAGGTPDAAGEFLVQRYMQAGARFRGIEAEWTWKPEGSPATLRVFGDVVRAKLADGANLPRISPARLGFDAGLRSGPWSGNLTVIRAFPQNRTAPLETPTPGYTRMDAEVAWRLDSGDRSAITLFLQGSNLLDRDIRLHTSYLKEVAPAMGRSFTLGLRGEF